MGEYQPTKHYLGAYGHDYYYNQDGVLMGQPANADGSFEADETMATPVDYFVEPLTDEELEDVIINLQLQ